MLQLTNSTLPVLGENKTVTNGAALVQTLSHAGSYASMSVVAPTAVLAQPGIIAPPIVSVQVLIPSYVGTTVTIPLPVDSTQPLPPTPSLVYSGGVMFTPALIPTSPRGGEFTFNPVLQTLVLYTSPVYPLTPGLTLTIIGASNSVIPSDRVSGTLISALYGLPVVGAITWNCSTEQHPTGNLALTVLRSSITAIRDRFKKGTVLEIATIGFSVSNYSEKLVNTFSAQQNLYEVQVSLTGKWDAPIYNSTSYLIPGFNPNSATVFQDPDCVLGAGGGVTNSGSKKTHTTVAELAAQVGVTFTGSSTSIPIPSDTPKSATIDWLSAAKSSIRHNNTFLDLCSPTSANAKNLDSTVLWRYTVPEIDVATSGNTTYSNSYFGYAAEYKNALLDGDFATPTSIPVNAEDTQGSSGITTEPRWKNRKPVKRTLTSGSIEASIPYDHTTTLKTLSHNWDTSGDTKTLKQITTEDGSPTLEEEWINGFAYTSFDIVNSNSGVLQGNPPGFWQVVQYKRTEYLYDKGTGYALGSNTTGWRLGRFKTETDEGLEAYANRAEPKLLPLYQFKQLPTTSVTRYALLQFSDYYKDAAKELPPIEFYKKCLPDGSSQLLYKVDPTYVAPFFVSEEMTYTNSFNSTPDPAAADADKDSGIPPDLITGEESFTHVRRVISPSVNTTFKVPGSGNQAKGSDRYTEFRMESSAQGAGFNDKSMRETFEEFDGQPNAATRILSLLEKVEPELNNPPTQLSTKQYEYRLTTPGYTTSSPSTDSFSNPYATTPEQALIAAKAELKMQDISNSVQFSTAIPFNAQLRCMDKVAIAAGGDSYATRVISFSNSLLIQGQLDGFPLLTAPEGTKLVCGIDREIPVTLHKIELPMQPKSTLVVNLPAKYVGLTLGQLISPDLKTRRNY